MRTYETAETFDRPDEEVNVVGDCPVFDRCSPPAARTAHGRDL
jgi:hypothetical protein